MKKAVTRSTPLGTSQLHYPDLKQHRNKKSLNELVWNSYSKEERNLRVLACSALSRGLKSFKGVSRSSFTVFKIEPQLKKWYHKIVEVGQALLNFSSSPNKVTASEGERYR